MKSSKLNVRELVLFGVLGAMTFALKVVMAGLPNIEPVTLCLLVYGAVFGYKALYPCFIYVTMEVLYFGLGTWNICYLYVWPIPVILGVFLREIKPSLVWALVAAVFGLLFGALCGIVDAFIGGIGYAVAKWASGIPFDIAHCLGNFGMVLILFKPLRQLLDKLYRQTHK
jgi:energy-coupling factor transport system substrate-specific component